MLQGYLVRMHAGQMKVAGSRKTLSQFSAPRRLPRQRVHKLRAAWPMVFQSNFSIATVRAFLSIAMR
jgi:hypothetical protein